MLEDFPSQSNGGEGWQRHPSSQHSGVLAKGNWGAGTEAERQI